MSCPNCNCASCQTRFSGWATYNASGIYASDHAAAAKQQAEALASLAETFKRLLPPEPEPEERQSGAEQIREDREAADG